MLVFVACGDPAANTGGAAVGGAVDGGLGAGPAELGGMAAAGGEGTGAGVGGGGNSGLGAGGSGGTGGAGGAQPLPCANTENLQPAPDRFQNIGDCQILFCVDDELVPSDDDSDLPLDDGDECTSAHCYSGTPLVMVDVGTQCGVDGLCSSGGACVECLASDDCLGNVGGELCDGNNTCVECLSPTDCELPGACGTATCTAGLCGTVAEAAGTGPASCFPYVCDGTSTDCPTSCSTDADCAGQTCTGGVCMPTGACDLQWVSAVTELCDPTVSSGTLEAVHLNGQISVSASVGWVPFKYSVQRYGTNGSQTGQWLADNSSSYEYCSLEFGPLGGWGSNCGYDFGAAAQQSFINQQYAWSTGCGGAALSVSGGAAIDGANNVHFSATVFNLPPTPSTTCSSKRTIEGVVLPNSTPFVATGPSQTLPADFGASVLSQLTSSDTRVNADGTIALTGTSAGSVDFGGGPMPPLDTSDVIIARFDPQGALLWAQRYPAAGSSPTLVKNPWIAGDGSVVAIGQFTSADFGFGPMTPQAPSSRFLVKLDSSGDPVCARAIIADKVLLGPSGEVVLARAGGPMRVDDATIGSGPYACSPGATVTSLTLGRLAP